MIDSLYTGIVVITMFLFGSLLFQGLQPTHLTRRKQAPVRSRRNNRRNPRS